jgi:hypothetical protein
MELHDRIMVASKPSAWSLTRRGRSSPKRQRAFSAKINAKVDQYIFITMAGTQRQSLLGYRQPKHGRPMDFLHDIRGRLIGQAEMQRTAFISNRAAIGEVFGSDQKETHSAKHPQR